MSLVSAQIAGTEIRLALLRAATTLSVRIFALFALRMNGTAIQVGFFAISKEVIIRSALVFYTQALYQASMSPILLSELDLL